MQYIFGENEQIQQAFHDGLLPEDSIILTKEAGKILNLCYFDNNQLQFKEDLIAYDNKQYGLTPEVNGLAIIDAAKSQFLNKNLTIKTVPGYQVVNEQNGLTVTIAGSYYEEDNLNEYDDAEEGDNEELSANKIIFAGKTLIDLTEDTITPEKLLIGATAHNSAGEIIEGTLSLRDITFDPQNELATSADILEGKNAIVDGTPVQGSMINNSALLNNNQIEIQTKNDLINLTLSGYYNDTTLNFGTNLTNLQAQYIAKGVSILGTEGSLAIENKRYNVQPTFLEQLIQPSQGYSGFSSLKIDSIPIKQIEHTLYIGENIPVNGANAFNNNITVNKLYLHGNANGEETPIFDISDTTITSSKISYGEIAYDANGAQITGTGVLLNPEDVSSVASFATDADIAAGKSAFNQNGELITGTYSMSSPTSGSVTYTCGIPGTGEFQINNGVINLNNGNYENYQIILKDLQNLIPGNICKNVSILGVTGTYDISTDNSIITTNLAPHFADYTATINNVQINLQGFFNKHTTTAQGESLTIYKIGQCQNSITASGPIKINSNDQITAIDQIWIADDYGNTTKIIDFTQTDITPRDIRLGKKAYGPHGTLITGTTSFETPDIIWRADIEAM